MKTRRSHPAPTATVSARQRGCSAAKLFEELWLALTDIMGPTATAAVLERSIGRATSRINLSGVVISQQQLVYRYTLPESWDSVNDEQALAGFRHIVRELVPLLTELTGTVIVRRLLDVPELKRCGAFTETAS
jgi:hypothetical protein